MLCREPEGSRSSRALLDRAFKPTLPGAVEIDSTQNSSPTLFTVMAATRLLGLSGSLRAASINSAVLRAARLVAPAGIEIAIYERLALLPHFNPDDDNERPPHEVAALRARVAGADGLLVACPEYAHGVPGAFKNALDWLVSSPEFAGKPVALVNTAARAFHAQASLRETLVMMSARLAPEAFVTLPFLEPATDAETLADDERVALPLKTALQTFASFIHGGSR